MSRQSQHNGLTDVDYAYTDGVHDAQSDGEMARMCRTLRRAWYIEHNGFPLTEHYLKGYDDTVRAAESNDSARNRARR
jgi:hypothetical protein